VRSSVVLAASVFSKSSKLIFRIENFGHEINAELCFFYDNLSEGQSRTQTEQCGLQGQVGMFSEPSFL